MTEHQDPRHERETPPPRSSLVPGASSHDDPTEAELLAEDQQVRDLGSASRSCVAILTALLILALLLCVFLTWAFIIR